MNVQQLLIDAIQSDKFKNLVNQEALFPYFVKGGSEDFISFSLAHLGLPGSLQFMPQYSTHNARIDLAIFVDKELHTMVEFGNQFSLQFNHSNAALDKALLEASKRNLIAFEKIDLCTVQIVTNIIKIDATLASNIWTKHHLERYNSTESIANQQLAQERINTTFETLSQFMKNPLELENSPIHIKIPINNTLGEAELHFMITLGINASKRAQIAKLILKE